MGRRGGYVKKDGWNRQGQAGTAILRPSMLMRAFTRKQDSGPLSTQLFRIPVGWLIFFRLP